MKDNIIYRKIRDGEEEEVFDLVKACFDEYVFSDLTDEGTTEFFRAVREMIYDKPTSHFIIVAESKYGITGMIDIKDNNHVCLFFVAKDFQGKGIGRGLLERATAACVENNPKLREINVHSSLFAVPIYKNLGFIQTKPEQIQNGIRYVPMVRTLSKAKG